MFYLAWDRVELAKEYPRWKKTTLKKPSGTKQATKKRKLVYDGDD